MRDWTAIPQYLLFLKHFVDLQAALRAFKLVNAYP
jgi:hypothetical protein